jgi:excisionase family DNA binding protein
MKSKPPEVRLLSTVEAAKYLGVSRWTMHQLAVCGEIPVIRRFKSWRFDLQDLDAFIERAKENL